MLQIDKVSKKPYYVQVYEYFKAEIESGRMRAGTKVTVYTCPGYESRNQQTYG